MLNFCSLSLLLRWTPPGGILKDGQVGFLTAVLEPGFTKRYLYRPDGKMSHFNLEINGWKTFSQALDYHPNGALKSKKHWLMNTTGSTDQDITTEQRYILDNYGRLSEVVFDGGHLLNYMYDPLSRLDTLTLLAQSKYQFIYDQITGKLSVWSTK